MVFPRLVVLVVDVAVQMCLGAESLFALVALVWSFVVSFVVTVPVLVGWRTAWYQAQQGFELGEHALQLMDLVKFAPADIACKRRGFR